MLEIMARRLSAGDALVLVTVTASSGATPRGTGARMLVGAEGRICGTIGGGAVEYRCEQMALQVLQKKISAQQDFSLTRDDVQNLGMICGGEVNVFFHYIPEGDTDTAALAQEALRRVGEGEALWLISNIGSGGSLSLYTEKHGICGATVPDWVLSQLPRKPKLLKNEAECFCVEQIHSSSRVYIFGCGHVSRELEPVLSHVGFRCVMMDDRPEFARPDFFPTAEEVKVIDFNAIAESVTIGPEDFVCVMTRGHAYDTEIQAQILKCRPAYVGVIGSKKKAAGVRQVLKERHGLRDEELDLITTPIGLDIEAETPAEIAISIAAQLIQTRARLNEM